MWREKGRDFEMVGKRKKSALAHGLYIVWNGTAPPLVIYVYVVSLTESDYFLRDHFG